jgi:hypothetical protein
MNTGEANFFSQGIVDFEDFCSVPVAWELVRGNGVECEVPRADVPPNLPRINFILQGDLDRVLRERYAPSGRTHRVTARNTRDEEIRGTQVELRGCDEGGHRTSRIDLWK